MITKEEINERRVHDLGWGPLSTMAFPILANGMGCLFRLLLYVNDLFGV
jgi:hypothetical protein